MQEPPRRYIAELQEWELPRLDDRAYELVDEIVANASVRFFDREVLGDKFFEIFRARICELAQLAAMEAIE